MVLMPFVGTMEQIILFNLVFVVSAGLPYIDISATMDCPKVDGCSCDSGGHIKPEATFVGQMAYECDGRNNSLSEIPRNFSILTDYLYMTNHFIANLSSEDFQTMTNLRYITIICSNVSNIEDSTFHKQLFVEELHLNGNSLSSINTHTFQGLRNLRVLNLANNNIQTINSDSLVGMPYLKKLQLQGNQLSMLPKELLKPCINQLQELLLWDNPLKCDCDIVWLIDSRSNHFLKSATLCSLPTEKQGLELHYLIVEDFECSTSFLSLIITFSGCVAIIGLFMGLTLTLIHRRYFKIRDQKIPTSLQYPRYVYNYRVHRKFKFPILCDDSGVNHAC